ncbi:hypothetical protein M513_12358, partial [Trichuris suis]
MEAAPVEYARMSAERFVDMEALSRSSILRSFADIVINVCKNINLYPDQLVQRAAGIALTKLLRIRWLFGLVCRDFQLERLVEIYVSFLAKSSASLKHLEYLSCSLTLLKYNDKM